MQPFPTCRIQFSTDENPIRRGELDDKHISFPFTAKNGSFMSLFSFSRDFISHSQNKNPIHAVKFFHHLLFFQFYAVFSPFMAFFSHFLRKMERSYFVQPFPTCRIQFSTDDRRILRVGFDFQPINDAFSHEVKEIKG